ncbi:MAG: hypothetical protein IKS42_04500 [Oscillospiraceae bacterium]|nr:hypothetical protein [Oscillospiraceae bacterium]
MKKNMQLLRAMSEIRPQYIEDAGERTAKTGGITMRWRIAGGAAIAACFAVSAAVLMPGVQNALRETAASAESPAVQTEETTLPAETTAALMRTAEENETTAAAETALTEADYAAPALTLTTAETALLAENPVTEALTVQTAAAVQTEAQTEAAVQTEAPAVTTLAVTSAPRTTSHTVYDPEADRAYYEAHSDVMDAIYEEVREGMEVEREGGEFHMIAAPRYLVLQSYEEGIEAHTREQYDYLREQLGDTVYRIDDDYMMCDGYLVDMCALGYITEEEMFAYGDLVAYEGGRLPDEIIAISEDPEFLRRADELFSEIWSAKKSDAWYRMMNYNSAIENTHFAAYDNDDLTLWPHSIYLNDENIVAMVCYW